MQKILKAITLFAYFGLTIVSLIMANSIEQAKPGWRPIIAVGTGFFFGLILYVLILKTRRYFSLRNEPAFWWRSKFMGLVYGLIAFSVSLLLVFDKSWPEIQAPHLSDLFEQILFQLRPSIIEEVGFRFGISFFALRFYGVVPALIAGSIPFGILHLLNFISGEPIFWTYIFGTAFAGLFLTAVFLRYGLVAAIITHYSWNVLASLAPKIFGIEQETIEGGYTTIIVLLVLSMQLLAPIFKRDSLS